MTLSLISHNEFCNIIKRFINHNGISPSQREIANILGWSQTTVFKKIKLLSELGYLEYKPRIRRSIRILSNE